MANLLEKFRCADKFATFGLGYRCQKLRFVCGIKCKRFVSLVSQKVTVVPSGRSSLSIRITPLFTLPVVISMTGILTLC